MEGKPWSTNAKNYILELTLEEEKEYFHLLGKNKDVFALSCQEMSELNPKVVVHHLSIRKDVSLKKHPELMPEIEK